MGIIIPNTIRKQIKTIVADFESIIFLYKPLLKYYFINIIYNIDIYYFKISKKNRIRQSSTEERVSEKKESRYFEGDTMFGIRRTAKERWTFLDR